MTQAKCDEAGGNPANNAVAGGSAATPLLESLDE